MPQHFAFFNTKSGRAMLLPSQKRQRLANSDWRIAVVWRAVFLHCHPNFRSCRSTTLQSKPLSRRMNSALKNFRHQPLAKASGMKSFSQLLQRKGKGEIFMSERVTVQLNRSPLSRKRTTVSAVTPTSKCIRGRVKG